jgi:hypothetical protein
MTSTNLAGSSNSGSAERVQAGTGHFMLTLCRLAAPVSIRPPQSPHLKPFTFFTSCAPQPDGSEQLYLHMGYFETLSAAEKWVSAIRGRYPHAIATLAPTAFLRPSNAEASAPRNTDAPSESPRDSELTLARDDSLSDTQVMKILEKRDGVPASDDLDRQACDQIALLRPEDTGARQALKEAVAQSAPVSFAVQLQWSAEPIDLSRVPALAIFKTYTLYEIESHRAGRCRYFLRMGFFADPISAKQVALQVRANFVSAAVVPIEEREVTWAREASTGGSSIPCLVQRRADPALDSVSAPPAATKAQPSSDGPRRISRGGKTLEQTLKQLAERERWTDPDSLSDSGVRHLKVEVQEYYTTERS